MQEIPTINGSMPVNLLEFIAATIILVVLIAFLGNRNRATKPQYWAISVVEVAVFAISWLFLALMTDAFVYTHIRLPIEVKPIVIDILNILSYLGFCIILIFIETRRGSPKRDSEYSI